MRSQFAFHCLFVSPQPLSASLQYLLSMQSKHDPALTSFCDVNDWKVIAYLGFISPKYPYVMSNHMKLPQPGPRTSLSDHILKRKKASLSQKQLYTMTPRDRPCPGKLWYCIIRIKFPVKTMLRKSPLFRQSYLFHIVDKLTHGFVPAQRPVET